MICGDSLRQREKEQYRIRKAERCRKEERNMNAPMTQYPTDCWSKNKAEPKCSVDQSHAFRAVLFRCDVGNVSLRCRDVSASDAVENATDKEHPDCCGKSKDQKTDSSANDRKQQ